MSECGGAHTLSNPIDNVTGVGRTLGGVASKIDKPDKDGNGEVDFNACFVLNVTCTWMLIMDNLYKN